MSKVRPAIPQTAELLSLVLAIFVVLLITGFSYRAWTSFNRGSEQLAMTTQVIGQAHALLSYLTDAETGQRGFLLTGDELYLEPYRQALMEIPVTLNVLKTSISSQPAQAQLFDRMLPLVNDKLAELAQTITVRRTAGPEAALAIVRTNRGKAVMDRIRTLCTTIETGANRSLILYSEKSHASADQLGVIATIGSAVLFILLGIATTTIQRGTQRRQQLITALQESSDETNEAREWLQTTLRSIGDGVIATDHEGRVVFLNSVAQELTGWTEEEARGTDLEKIFIIRSEETSDTVENPVRRVLREGRIVGLANHTKLTSKDGRSISIDDSAAPIRSRSGQAIGVVLVFRNVTEAREIERQQERARIALASANKDLQQFAFAASHDLREPLRTVKIFAQLLQRDGLKLTDDERHHLDFIIGGTDRMEQLVNGLLEYSTAGAVSDTPWRETNVEDAMSKTLENLRAAIAESGAVVTHDSLPAIGCEPAHVALVLQNLVSNAIKYRGDDPPRVHVSAKKGGEEWIFSVRDNGVGIAREYHSAIFGMFKRLHDQDVSGSGIGLATCRRIVERYGGRLWLESELGKGSTFFFSLPLHNQAVPQQA